MGTEGDRLPTGGFARLVPEIDVFDLARSKTFWCDILGFQIAYQRPENLFMYIELQRAQVMLKQKMGTGKPGLWSSRWGAGSIFKFSSALLLLLSML